MRKYTLYIFKVRIDIILSILYIAGTVFNVGRPTRKAEMTTHKQLKGNRLTTSVNMHSRTLDILKNIKTQRKESGIMGFFDKLFSSNQQLREEAMSWLYQFHQGVLPHAFEFLEEEGRWRYILEEAPDPDFPVVPEADKDKYYFDDHGKIKFYAKYQNLKQE